MRLQARVADLPLDGALAQALTVEQASLPIGRLEHDGRGVIATASLLGGGTLDVEEAITAAYAVAAVADAAPGAPDRAARGQPIRATSISSPTT